MGEFVIQGPVSVAVLLACALAASFIDVRTFRIPDIFVAFSCAVSACENAIVGVPVCVGRLLETVGVLGFMLLFRLAVNGRFGMGDIKLLCASTMALGVIGVFIELFAASLLGLAFGLCRKDMSRRIAFAPFLLAGMVTAVLTERDFQGWILGLV